MKSVTSEEVHKDVRRYSVESDDELLGNADFIAFIVFFITVLYLVNVRN